MENRIIKFRALVPVNSKETQSMHFFDLSKIDDCNRLSYADYDASELMQFTGLKDKNGVEIYEGDLIGATLNVKTGERTSTYKRRRSTFAVYSDVDAVGVVEMDDRGVWMWRSDKSITYNTGFWRGCGYTKSEKKANESRPTTYNLSKLLHEISGEVIGNKYQSIEP